MSRNWADDVPLSNRALDRKLDEVLHELRVTAREVLRELHAIKHKETRIMSALDDLKAAIDGLGTAVADGTAEIEVLLGKITAPGTSDADVAAAAKRITDITSALRAETDKAKAAAP